MPNDLNNLSDNDLAALMLKGLTAQFLLKRTYEVKKGDVIASKQGDISVNTHASIDGIVSKVTNQEITISRN